MDTLLNYLKNNIPLVIVLGAILVMLIVLIVLLVTEISRTKKRKAQEEAAQPATQEEHAPEKPEESAQPIAQEEPAQPAAQEEPAAEPVPEKTEEPTQPAAQEEIAQPAAQEEPAPEEQTSEEEKAPFVFVAVKEEKRQQPTKAKKPATAPAAAEMKEDDMKQESKPDRKKEAKAAPAKKPEPKAAAAKKPEPKAAPAKKETAGAAGKWVIDNVKGKYWLSLIAPNGQVMLESPTAYATLSSARSGIKTYQDNIAAGKMEITEHKNGDSQVQVLNARGGLLATSSTYSSRSQAESALASIKRWAATTVIVENGDDKK